MSESMPPTDAVGDADREAASENPLESRRGRPRVTSEAWERVMDMTGDSRRLSRRTIVNHFYRQRAFEVLSDTEGQDFSWLIGDNRGEGKFGSEILVELGRIDHDEEIREAAAWLCEQRPKTKEAVALLRRCRTGKSQPGTALTLAVEIGKTIDAYVFRHPGTTPDQVRNALWYVGLHFAEDDDAAK